MNNQIIMPKRENFNFEQKEGEIHIKGYLTSIVHSLASKAKRTVYN